MMFRTEKITFKNKEGEELHGRLELPLHEPQAFAIFAHCFTCSKNIVAASRVSRALAETGIAVLRFDFTGLGNSEGDFANTNFSSNVEDLVCAARFLKVHHGTPSLLIGHSLGGAAVLKAATKLPEIRAVVTIGAPFDAAHVTKNFHAHLEKIQTDGEAEVELAGRKFSIKKQFLDDLETQNAKETISNLGKALLVMHAPHDQVVGIDNARQIFEHAKHPKSFISLDQADHLLSKTIDSEFVAQTVACWSRRYLDISESSSSKAEVDGVRVQGSTLTQEIQAGTHTFLADEPTSVGGKNLGPTPYDYLLAALGACTSMTMQMYAKRKQWNIGSTRVDLKHERIHAEDCEDCEQSSGKIEQITRFVTLAEGLTAEQKTKLLEIADKCPVHRTLHNAQLKIKTMEGS